MLMSQGGRRVVVLLSIMGDVFFGSSKDVLMLVSTVSIYYLTSTHGKDSSTRNVSWVTERQS